MTTVEELVVRAKPQGIEQTNDQLNEMEQEFNQTAESMEETTGQLESLQEDWQGAMGAMVAGLATAVGGILSTVPVLGQVAAGFGAIISAIGFQIDQLLRDLGMGGLAGMLFMVANAIYRAEGALGDLIGALSLVAGAIFGALGGLLLFIAHTEGVKVAAVVLGRALASLVTSFASVIPWVFAAAGVVGTFIGLLGVAALEVTGVLAKIKQFGKVVGQDLPKWLRDALIAMSTIFTLLGAVITGFVDGALHGKGGLQSRFASGVESAMGRAGKALNILSGAFVRTNQRIAAMLVEIVSTIYSFVGRIKGAAIAIDTAIDNVLWDLKKQGMVYAKRLINGIVKGVKNNIGKVANAAGNIAGAIDKKLPGSPAEEGPLSDLDEAGPGLVETFSEGINSNLGTVASAGENVAEAADPDGFAASRRGSVRLFMDGRELTEQDGRYRRDKTSRRGRNG